MTVSEILKAKGTGVKTVGLNVSAQVLARQMKDEQIGAMIVTDDGGSIMGIISERDLAYGLASLGSGLAGTAVADLMTRRSPRARPRTPWLMWLA